MALSKLLLLCVVGDLVGGSAHGPVVGAEAVYGVAAGVASEEGLFERVEVDWATLFSRWNCSSANTRRNMSLVRMCWSSISRTSA